MDGRTDERKDGRMDGPLKLGVEFEFYTFDMVRKMFMWLRPTAQRKYVIAVQLTSELSRDRMENFRKIHRIFF